MRSQIVSAKFLGDRNGPQTAIELHQSGGRFWPIAAHAFESTTRSLTAHMSEREFFQGNAKARAVYRAVKRVTDDMGGVKTRVSKSQIGFYRKHPSASVWRPGQYLEGERPPLVLTIFLRRRDTSSRWKQVVEPHPGRFTHHIELGAATEVDDEIRGWIVEAWGEAA